MTKRIRPIFKQFDLKKQKEKELAQRPEFMSVRSPLKPKVSVSYAELPQFLLDNPIPRDTLLDSDWDLDAELLPIEFIGPEEVEIAWDLTTEVAIETHPEYVEYASNIYRSKVNDYGHMFGFKDYVDPRDEGYVQLPKEHYPGYQGRETLDKQQLINRSTWEAKFMHPFYVKHLQGLEWRPTLWQHFFEQTVAIPWGQGPGHPYKKKTNPSAGPQPSDNSTNNLNSIQKREAAREKSMMRFFAVIAPMNKNFITNPIPQEPNLVQTKENENVSLTQPSTKIDVDVEKPYLGYSALIIPIGINCFKCVTNLKLVTHSVETQYLALARETITRDLDRAKVQRETIKTKQRVLRKEFETHLDSFLTHWNEFTKHYDLEYFDYAHKGLLIGGKYLFSIDDVCKNVKSWLFTGDIFQRLAEFLNFLVLLSRFFADYLSSMRNVSIQRNIYENRKLLELKFTEDPFMVYLDLNKDINEQLFLTSLVFGTSFISNTYRHKMYKFLRFLFKDECKALENMEDKVYLDPTGGLLYICYYYFIIMQSSLQSKTRVRLAELASIITKLEHYLVKSVSADVIEDDRLLKKIVEVKPYEPIYKQIYRKFIELKPNETLLFTSIHLGTHREPDPEAIKNVFFPNPDPEYTLFLSQRIQNIKAIPTFAIWTLIHSLYRSRHHLTQGETNRMKLFLKLLFKDNEKALDQLDLKLDLDPTGGLLYIIYYHFPFNDTAYFKDYYNILNGILRDLVYNVFATEDAPILRYTKNQHVAKHVHKWLTGVSLHGFNTPKVILRFLIPLSPNAWINNVSEHLAQTIALYHYNMYVHENETYLYGSGHFLSYVLKMQLAPPSYGSFSFDKPFEDYLINRSVSDHEDVNAKELMELVLDPCELNLDKRYPQRKIYNLVEIDMASLNYYIRFLLTFVEQPACLLFLCHHPRYKVCGWDFIRFCKRWRLGTNAPKYKVPKGSKVRAELSREELKSLFNYITEYNRINGASYFVEHAEVPTSSYMDVEAFPMDIREFNVRSKRFERGALDPLTFIAEVMQLTLARSLYFTEQKTRALVSYRKIYPFASEEWLEWLVINRIYVWTRWVAFLPVEHQGPTDEVLRLDNVLNPAFDFLNWWTADANNAKNTLIYNPYPKMYLPPDENE